MSSRSPNDRQRPDTDGHRQRLTPPAQPNHRNATWPRHSWTSRCRSRIVPIPHTLTGLAAEIAHLRTGLEALANPVRNHEERLRHLERRQPHRKAN